MNNQRLSNILQSQQANRYGCGATDVECYVNRVVNDVESYFSNVTGLANTLGSGAANDIRGAISNVGGLANNFGTTFISEAGTAFNSVKSLATNYGPQLASGAETAIGTIATLGENLTVDFINEAKSAVGEIEAISSSVGTALGNDVLAGFNDVKNGIGDIEQAIANISPINIIDDIKKGFIILGVGLFIVVLLVLVMFVWMIRSAKNEASKELKRL